jgi:hypothetical protein
MANEEKRSIFTALASIFGRSKPEEFSTRIGIEQALQATNSTNATTPAVEPTVIAKKGMGVGVYVDRTDGPVFHRYLDRENLRHARYSIYDRMDTDLVASALDVYANESTQKGNNATVINVSSSSKYIQDELMDMLENTGLNNYKSWSILRDMCKYGDRFESVKLDARRGVVGLLQLDPRGVYRLDVDGELQGYVQDMEVVRQNSMDASSQYSTQSPFIDLTTLSLPYMTRKMKTSTETDKDNLIPFLKYEMMHFRLRGRGIFEPYGTSVLESAVDVWKKLDLLLDSIIIYRLNRGPARLVFYVDVGNNQGGDIENLVKRQINSINKREYYDPTGRLNERYQLLDMNANIFIPVSKTAQNSKVEMLQPAQNLGDIEDLNYLNNRLFSALKVPKAFLGFEGDVNSKGTLSQQNVTFGKAIQNIQEDFLDVVKNLCVIHLAIKGITDQSELKSFNLIMTRPSYVEEKSRIELDGEAMNLAGSYLAQGINRNWVLKNILKKDDADIKEMTELDPQAAQAAAGMGGMGGAPMGGMPGLDAGATPMEAQPMMPPEPGAEAPPNVLNPANMPTPAPTPAGAPLTQGRKYVPLSKNASALYEGTYIDTTMKVRSPVGLVTEYRQLMLSKGDGNETPSETIVEDNEILDSLSIDAITQNTTRLID